MNVIVSLATNDEHGIDTGRVSAVVGMDLELCARHRRQLVWARRFVMHDNGIFLVPARTETAWFRLLWKHCSGIFFTYRRIQFIRGSTGEVGKQQVYGSVFAACGLSNLESLSNLPIPGVIVTGREILEPRAADQSIPAH